MGRSIAIDTVVGQLQGHVVCECKISCASAKIDRLVKSKDDKFHISPEKSLFKHLSVGKIFKSNSKVLHGGKIALVRCRLQK